MRLAMLVAVGGLFLGVVPCARADDASDAFLRAGALQEAGQYGDAAQALRRAVRGITRLSDDDREEVDATLAALEAGDGGTSIDGLAVARWFVRFEGVVVDGDARATAGRLFVVGRAALSAGDARRAMAAFAQADYRLDSPAIHFQLADGFARAGFGVRAARELERCLRTAHLAPADHQTLQDAIAALVAEEAVNVAELGPSGAFVTIDDGVLRPVEHAVVVESVARSAPDPEQPIRRRVFVDGTWAQFVFPAFVSTIGGDRSPDGGVWVGGGVTIAHALFSYGIPVFRAHLTVGYSSRWVGIGVDVGGGAGISYVLIGSFDVGPAMRFGAVDGLNVRLTLHWYAVPSTFSYPAGGELSLEAPVGDRGWLQLKARGDYRMYFGGLVTFGAAHQLGPTSKGKSYFTWGVGGGYYTAPVGVLQFGYERRW